MRTLFRLTVMMSSMAAGVWALTEYGPPDTVQPIARRAIELADELIGRPGTSGDAASQASTEFTSLPTTFPAVELPSVDSPVSQSPVSQPSAMSPPPLASEATTQPTPGRLRMEPVALAASSFPNDAPFANNTPFASESATATGDELLSAALQRLRSVGATNIAATPWGRSGQLYRVSCEVPIGGRADMTRHVEAVATSQSAAADDVLRNIQSGRAPSYPVATLD